MRPGMIKICGLRETEHAVAAAEGGADMIGFIFAPARRYVAPDIARHAIEAAKDAATGDLLAVGVFVDASVASMNAIADEAGIDVIQLSGDELPGDLVGISRPVIKVIRAPTGAAPEELIRVIDLWNGNLPPMTFLVEGQHGGSGAQADWHLAAKVASRQPMMLAGGLNPANVSEAISAVGPIGVDVSSGVEVDGGKDGDTIRAFIDRARTAFSLRPAKR